MPYKRVIFWRHHTTQHFAPKSAGWKIFDTYVVSIMLFSIRYTNMVRSLHLALGLTAITYEKLQPGVLNCCISSENIGDIMS
jgi:hypothetical protein